MGRDKLLIEVGGRTIFETTLSNYLGTSLDGICAVVPGWLAGFKTVMDSQTDPRTTYVKMERPCEMSHSLRAGWAWVRDNLSPGGVMIGLADQPLVRSVTIDRIIDCYLASSRPITVPVYRGRRGHPVIAGSEFDGDIMQLSGDRGARDILEHHPDVVHEVDVDSDEVLIDFDNIDELDAIKARLAAHG
jgi:molybdenum cofactor cytidylyltransferase